MSDVVLPELGEGIEKAVVACIHYKQGDHVDAQDDLLEVVTDKATFNVAAGVSGRVSSVLVKERQEISIGERLASIDPDPEGEQ